MCGIVGIVSEHHVNQGLFDALTVLQHRGQDASGMMTEEQNKVYIRKDNGLVRDVFQAHHIQRLPGTLGIGHVRYPTAGSASSLEAQPLYVNAPYGIGLAHNGNLVNADELRTELKSNLRHLNTDSDSEILLNVFAYELHKENHLVPRPEDIFKAIAALHRRCKGAYAAVAMLVGYGLVGFRDPHGIRPLVMGKKQCDSGGVEYMLASESVALDALGFELMRDVAPGEGVFISVDGQIYTQKCADDCLLTPCIFEHVYLARPDSIIDQISVYKTRLRMGEKLAEKILKIWPKHDIDVVIPIPETSTTSAHPLAYRLGIKYREGFVKNRYIGRTFIMPGQVQRERSVKRKLNAIELEFKDKNVLLVDDSIVRGTTCRQIIQMAREKGAKKVYFASCAPPIRYANVYGIDMPARHELIAHGKSEDEICELIGADRIFYQDLSALVECAQEGNAKIDQFECSVFDGRYITGGVDEAYLSKIGTHRSDSAKQQRVLNVV